MKFIRTSILGIVLAMFILVPFSFAHNYNEGYSYVHINERTIDFELLLPFPVLSPYDLDKNGEITDEELRQKQEEIETYMKERLVLENNGEKMTMETLIMEPVYQESTEDWVVRFDFRFSSMQPIHTIIVRYNVLVQDIDPTHQNYIQLYKDGTLMAHQVVWKDHNIFQYNPTKQVNYTLASLLTYVAIGFQSSIKNLYHVLLMLLISLQSVYSFRNKIKIALLYTSAMLAGFIVADRLSIALYSIWIAVSLTVIVLVKIKNRKKTLNDGDLYLYTLHGFIFGMTTPAFFMELGMYTQYKLISAASFYVGVLFGLAGIIYLLQTLMIPLIAKLKFHKIFKFRRKS